MYYMGSLCNLIKKMLWGFVWPWLFSVLIGEPMSYVDCNYRQLTLQVPVQISK